MDKNDTLKSFKKSTLQLKKTFCKLKTNTGFCYHVHNVLAF